MVCRCCWRCCYCRRFLFFFFHASFCVCGLMKCSCECPHSKETAAAATITKTKRIQLCSCLHLCGTCDRYYFKIINISQTEHEAISNVSKSTIGSSMQHLKMPILTFTICLEYLQYARDNCSVLCKRTNPIHANAKLWKINKWHFVIFILFKFDNVCSINTLSRAVMHLPVNCLTDANIVFVSL